MEDHHKWTADDEKVARIIRLKAKRLIESAEFKEGERKDIEQELHLQWLLRQSRFDPTRGELETFADVVLNNAIRTMIEERRAAKRDYRLCTCSLDDPIDVQGEKGMTLHETYDQDDYFQATGRKNQPQRELDDLRLDIRRALRRLSPSQRELALRLRTQTVAEAARAMKIPRTTLYGWLEHVRVVFAELGLDEYL